jgi:C1A family cysteine protease
LKVSNHIPLKEAKIPDVALPQEFDWRDYNIVTKVKNQVILSSSIFSSYICNLVYSLIKEGKLKLALCLTI